MLISNIKKKTTATPTTKPPVNNHVISPPVAVQKVTPSGNKFDLGIVKTEKKPFNNALLKNVTANKAKEEVVEISKKQSYLDNVIPGMFLNDDYKCIIKRHEIKGKEIVEYDWQLANRNTNLLQIPVCSFFIDSDGDLHLTGKLGEDSICHITIMNDENSTKFEELLNNPNTETTTRRRSSNIDTSKLVEICSISYNDWQKISKTTVDAEGETLSFTDFVHYDRRDHEITKRDGTKGIRYEGALMCMPDTYDYFVEFVNQWIKGQDKETSIIFTN